jgi:hypothetical protein
VCVASEGEKKDKKTNNFGNADCLTEMSVVLVGKEDIYSILTHRKRIR